MVEKGSVRHKEFIRISHERCKMYNINYNQIYSNKILDEKELFEKMEENRELVLAAAPIMNKIYDFVKGSNFFSILTDKEGCILNVIGDEEILSEAFLFKMIPGAYMDEENIGTNAMGTCITENNPIQVSAEEHFISAYHRWTCSGCPIKDESGKIIGTLDLTGYSEQVHSHTLGMVVAGARAIENQLMNNKLRSKLLTEKKQQKLILDSILKGFITADMQGVILSANSFASELFGCSNEELLHMKTSDLLKDWNSVYKSVIEDTSPFKRDVDVISKRNILQLNLTVYPVKNQNNEATNVILVFDEVKKQRKSIDSIMGRHAIYTFDKIVGKDANFLQVINFAKKISDSRSNILIMGESGTGKELFAQSIHNYSERSNGSFVALNCGAIPRNLIESELFGYEQGSFTGAKAGGNPGKFEIADGGTIFLDEIGEMPLDLQTRLLRVIEEGTVSRIGSSHERVVDVRVIAATNKNLKQEVENGTFRKDLFYRLNVLPLRLPSLCERKGDIKLLLDYFMDRISKKLNKKKVHIPLEYIEKLVEYNWPGNVRELENYVELAVNTEMVPDIHMLNFEESSNKSIKIKSAANVSSVLSLKEMEKEHIVNVLESTGHNITQAASVLGIGRNTLYRKLKEFEIEC
ncbi:sigma-54-dependent Fis family transcriptional regulator [Sedimentibacter sp. B4]|uniref:sigma-54-dependent Fis family transcriptional regulator n=1 Tax=Sedimentibacter sp. B4 TaxID=304766 RepID=UPI0003061CF7|nr:sigma-54-dependent Fis family transcriptional regulator [Sedimentibacter sp. B4]